MDTLTPAYVARRIRQSPPAGCGVIPGSTPVVSFGDPAVAWVATVGSNPGASAFVVQGKLVAEYFETLSSLGITDVSSAADAHVDQIYRRCTEYFRLPRHRRWFDQQKSIVGAVGASYEDDTACHLDAVQWATSPTWTQLSSATRRQLLSRDGPFLREQLEQNTTLQLILLNGDAVFTDFKSSVSPEGTWSTFSLGNRAVRVMFWTGRIRFPTHLVHIIGWDKNLQGTYGMTASLRAHVLEKLADLWQGVR